MNCIYDCEYCYLKGMYPSANVVLFVNLEDIFAEVERLLEQHSVYLCVSYDTDLLAVEPVIGYTAEWMRFTTEHENLTIEVRTKSANVHYFKQQAVTERVIFAFTMSPQRSLRHMNILRRICRRGLRVRQKQYSGDFPCVWHPTR